MADPRHFPDTMFIVLEEDWRLFQRDTQVTSETIGLAALPKPSGSGSADTYSEAEVYKFRTQGLPGPGVPFAPVAQAAPSPDSTGVPFAPGPDEDLLTHERPRKLQKGEPAVISPYLAELLQVCTAAHRKQMGGMIWLSWDGACKKGSKIKPSHALTAIAIRATVATDMLLCSSEFEKGHFDVQLRNMLMDKEKNWAQKWEASFVYPCIGHYVDHESGCEKNLYRKGTWGKSWVQGGVKPDRGQNDRWLCDYTGGDTQWKFKLDFTDASLTWKTLKIENVVEDEEATARDEDYVAFGGSRVLQLDGTTLFHDHGEPSDRKKRAERGILNLYKRRNFVNNMTEASLAGMIQGVLQPFRSLVCLSPQAPS